MSHYTTGRLTTRVTLWFNGPDYNEKRNKQPVTASGDFSDHFYQAEFEFDCIDFDYGVLTVNEDLRDGDNMRFAVAAPLMNECGEECGDIAWRIDPDPQLLAMRPDIEPYIGRVYGRWYVANTQLIYGPKE